MDPWAKNHVISCYICQGLGLLLKSHRLQLRGQGLDPVEPTLSPPTWDIVSLSFLCIKVIGSKYGSQFRKNLVKIFCLFLYIYVCMYTHIQGWDPRLVS